METRTEKKRRLEQAIRTLNTQLGDLDQQLREIQREERAEKQAAADLAKAAALHTIRVRMQDTAILRAKLATLPSRDFTQIDSNDARFWLTVLLGLSVEYRDDRHDWKSWVNYWDLDRDEWQAFTQKIRGLIKEIRDERKQAWLSTHILVSKPS